MSKPRKLSRPEIEALAAFFGCRVTTQQGYTLSGMTWNVYIVYKAERKKIGTVATNDPACLSWTNHDWTKAFQCISGVSNADLWYRRGAK